MSRSMASRHASKALRRLKDKCVGGHWWDSCQSCHLVGLALPTTYVPTFNVSLDLSMLAASMHHANHARLLCVYHSSVYTLSSQS